MGRLRLSEKDWGGEVVERIVKEQQSDAGGKAAGAKPDEAACQAAGLTGGGGDE